MKKRIIISILMLIFANHLIYSQLDISEPVKFPTPTSANFLKYGDLPVNEYTGRALIDIPIYNINLDDVTIPLSINYATGGIKVSQDAGIVGLGWDFFMPTIVQTIVDEDDYDRSTKQKRLPDYVGSPIFASTGLLHPSIPGVNNNSGDSFSGSPGYQDYPVYFKSSGDFIVLNGSYVCHPSSGNYYNEFYNYGYDTEPDIFTLNLNGDKIVMSTIFPKNCYSHFDCENLDIKIINGRNEYKINKIIETDISKKLFIKGFEVIDSGSNKFYFDVIDETITYSSSNGHLVPNSSENNKISTRIFRLSKIKTSKGKDIKFNYNTISISEYPKYSKKFYRKTGNTTINYGFSYGEYDDFINNSQSAYYDSFIGGDYESDTSNASSSFVQNENFKYLTSITTPKEKIYMNYSSRIDFKNMIKLDNIVVKDYNNLYFTDFTFKYSYFDSDPNFYGTNNIDNKRLKLVSFQENGQPSYLFDYNSTKLPSKNSFAIDYWGYFNGHPNDSYIPPLLELGYPEYNDKKNNNFKANLFYSEAASLKKITYPTGGSTEFVYELHQFDNLFITNKPNPITTGAGLRIQKVISKSNNNSIPILTNYVYNSGKVINKIKLAQTYTEKNLRRFGSSDGGSYYTKMYITPVLEVSSSNTFTSRGAINNSSNYVGYDSVEIINSEGQFGKTRKIFSNSLPEIYSLGEGKNFNPIYIYDRFKKKNGTLLKEEFINKDGEIIQTKNYSYKVIQEPDYNNTHNYGLNISKYSNGLYNDGGAASYAGVYSISNFLLTFYPIYDSTTLPTGITTTDFTTNGLSIETSRSTSYNSNNQPSIKSNRIIGGAERTTNISYNILSDSGITSEDNLLSKPYRISSKYNNSGYFSDKYYHYKKYPEYNNAILLENEWDCSRGAYPPYDIKGCTNISYNLYDERGNILEYQIEDNKTVVIIWGYNKNYPIAKIENATYSEISNQVANLQNLSNQDTDRTYGSIGKEGALRTALNSLRNLSAISDALVTTYTYDPLIGVTSVTDPLGNTVYYSYENNKLKFVKDRYGNFIKAYEYNFKIKN